MDNTITPLAIGLDKLRFGTNTFGSASRRNTLSVCRDLARAKEARKLSDTGRTHKHRYSITVAEGQTLYVAFSPNRKDGGHPKFVAEFNPAKLGPNGVEEVRVVLRQFFEERYENVMSGAFVTLVDYFADYPVRVQDLYIEMTRKESCAIWGVQFGGRWEPQTYYFGSGGSDGQTRVYDRAAQATADAAKHGRDGQIDQVFGEEGREVGCRMRVETRRFPGSIPLSRLHELENPFARISIARITSDAPEFQTPLGRVLLSAASAVGWQVALQRLGDVNEVRRYRRAFAKYKCEWWDPDQAAVDVAVAVLRLGLFPESAFDPRVVRRARHSKTGSVPTFSRDDLKVARKEKRKTKTGTDDLLFSDLDSE
jgi:hypothetical protein